MSALPALLLAAHANAVHAAAPLSSSPENYDPGYTVSSGLGTTGASAHVGVPLSSSLSARVGVNFLNYRSSGKTAGLDYDLALKGRTLDVLLDWYPAHGSAFRLTSGVAWNGNRIEVKARPNASGTYTVNGTVYNAASAGTVEGQADFPKLAPYLGFGWGQRAPGAKGWSFSADAGVLIQGAPNVGLSSRGCTSPVAVCNQLASDVKKENDAVTSEVGRYKMYPVLRVGATYRF